MVLFSQIKVRVASRFRPYSRAMTKGRLEAFSDGVMAIIITIMVLELRAPAGSQLTDLANVGRVFWSYLLSFVFVGIYWNNHHHLLQAVTVVRGWTLWANLHLLFWLSLVPWATQWMGNTGIQQGPVALYGFILLMAAISYSILVRTLLLHHESDSALARAIGEDVKGRISLLLYTMAIGVSQFQPVISIVLYCIVGVIWLYPDYRIERALSDEGCLETRK